MSRSSPEDCLRVAAWIGAPKWGSFAPSFNLLHMQMQGLSEADLWLAVTDYREEMDLRVTGLSQNDSVWLEKV